MFEQDGFLLFQRRLRQPRPGAEEVRGLGEEPGAAVAASADHDAVRAGFRQGGGGVFLGQDVAVDDDGDGDRLLDLADEIPIGDAGVELLAGAAVDVTIRMPDVLGNAGEARGVQAGVVPAHAHLQGNGN